MNDREALEKLRENGRQRADAVGYLYRRYAPRFLAYFMRHRLSQREANALVEDVFVAVVRQCDAFFGEVRPDAWLWGIARGALLDHFRGRRPDEIADDHALETLVEPAEPAPAPVGGVPASSPAECARAAYAAFAAAHADRAEMLSRVALDGWTIDDVAAALKRTPGAARDYLAETRAKLKVLLKPCDETPPA